MTLTWQHLNFEVCSHSKHAKEDVCVILNGQKPDPDYFGIRQAGPTFDEAPQCGDELTEDAIQDESGRYWSVLEVRLEMLVQRKAPGHQLTCLFWG